LKISAPLNNEDYERTIKDLDELREALIYWGKITQRQNKIKFIRGAKNISSMEEYQKIADTEEQYVLDQKQLFTGDANTENKSTINTDKLKTAQIIDREIRNNKAWENEQMG